MYTPGRAEELSNDHLTQLLNLLLAGLQTDELFQSPHSRLRRPAMKNRYQIRSSLERRQSIPNLFRLRVSIEEPPDHRGQFLLGFHRFHKLLRNPLRPTSSRLCRFSFRDHVDQPLLDSAIQPLKPFLQRAIFAECTLQLCGRFQLSRRSIRSDPKYRCGPRRNSRGLLNFLIHDEIVFAVSGRKERRWEPATIDVDVNSKHASNAPCVLNAERQSDDRPVETVSTEFR